jgi:putative acetyltransferase
MGMIIRDERPADIAAIRRITDAAFEDVPQSRQTEAAVIDALRSAEAMTAAGRLDRIGRAGTLSS